MSTLPSSANKSRYQQLNDSLKPTHLRVSHQQCRLKRISVIRIMAITLLSLWSIITMLETVQFSVRSDSNSHQNGPELMNASFRSEQRLRHK